MGKKEPKVETKIKPVCVISDETKHKNVCNEIHQLYVDKNHDYGDSAAKMYKEFGLMSIVYRLQDKVNRLKVLANEDARVKNESIRDTLMDISNYSAIGIVEHDKLVEKLNK
jgi:uncharacterized protein YcgL (UPF0745 family)